MAKAKDIFDSPIIIYYRGTYDYDGLVSLLRNYLMSLKPTMYAEPKFKFKTGKTGAEVDFKLVAERKITHYIKVSFTVATRAVDVVRKEMDVQGQKKIMTGGVVEIQLSGKFQVDYPGMYDDDKKLTKFMNKVLNEEPDGLLFEDNKVTGKKFGESILRDLDKKIKTFLKMECY